MHKGDVDKQHYPFDALVGGCKCCGWGKMNNWDVHMRRMEICGDIWRYMEIYGDISWGYYMCIYPMMIWFV